MKKICLLIILLLGLTAINSVGYVVLYPGVEFYNDDMTVGFSNTDGVNVSYIEVGDLYVVLGDLNLSLSCTGTVEVNFSQADSGLNLTSGTSVLRFNTTFSGSSITFSFYGNHSGAIYKLYTDTVLTSTHESQNFSWTHSSWSAHDFDIRLEGYRPDCPTDASSSYDANSHRVNVSWSAADSADNYIVMRRNDTYPTSRTDTSAYEVQNNSYLFYNETLTSTAYFSVWAWNQTTNYYSSDSCKLDLPWGAIVIYAVYNESNASQAVSPFSLLISNEDGTDTYWDNSVSNVPLYISKDDIPFGDNTIVNINASGYKTVRYYFDYALNNFYNHTFYIAPKYTIVDPGTGDEDDENDTHMTTRLYRLRCIDQYTYPIADAKANIKRYINTTDTYENTTIVITDGYGEADVYLVPNVNYKVFLTKTGYTQVGSNDWIPDPTWYGANYPKTFQMEYDDIDDTSRGFWDVITFNGNLYNNNTLKVIYIDSQTETINAKFETYEAFNFTRTLLSTNTTTEDSFTFWVTNVNISRVHQVTIHLNHTNVGWVNYTITINPIARSPVPKYDKSDIEDKTVGVFGVFSLGYVNFFLIFIPAVILLVIFGPRHAGLGIIGSGLYMGFTSFFITVPQQILYLIPLIVAIGFILIIVKEGGIKL